MKEENKNFRRRKNNKKKKSTLNLGIKVGDWFEDISGSEPGLKDFYMVKSLNQTSVRLVEIGTDNGELSEVLCGDYEIKNFKKVNDILEYDYLKLKRIGEDKARNRLRKINGVSLILECFGIDQKKVRPQNSSSTQSTASENKPKIAGGLEIKVGDYYHCSCSPYINHSSSKEYYIGITSVSHLDIGTKYDRYSIVGDGFNYTVENGIPKELKESEQKWTLRITKTGIEGGQKITKEEYDETLRKIKHQLQPETKPTTNSLSKKRIEEPKKEERLNLKVGDWFETKTNNVGNNTCLYCVKSINETNIVFTTIYAKLSNGSIETSIQEWSRDGFKRSGNNLIYTNLGISKFFTRISEEGAYYTVNSFSWQVGCILNCFRAPTSQPSSEETKENNLSKNRGQLWKRFKDLEGKYIKFYDGYGIQYLKVREVDYDSENYEFHISGFGPYLRRGTHDSWTNYVYNKETVLQGYLLQAQEISKEEFKKAKEMLRKKLSKSENNPVSVTNRPKQQESPTTQEKTAQLENSIPKVGDYYRNSLSFVSGDREEEYFKVIEVTKPCSSFHLVGKGFRIGLGKKNNIIYWVDNYTTRPIINPNQENTLEKITEEDYRKKLGEAKKIPTQTELDNKKIKRSSPEKTVRDFLEKDKKPLTDLVGKCLKLKYTQDDRIGTEYFRLKSIQKETYGDYQCCKIRYDNNRFSVNKKGNITYLTGENIQDTIPLESFKDAVIITEEEFNKARSGEGFKKQEKPIKIYTKEELKSSILKYTSPDGSIYYLEHPEIPKVGIENKPGKFKYCVVSYGIMINNGGQVHFYTSKINPFNPIVLLIGSESDEGFFSRVEEISDYEWASLKEFYRDKIVKI